MKLIAFDLGDTLVEYEGLPLSWEEYYLDALRALALSSGASPDSNQYQSACTALRKYNTRIYPREHEVEFSQILVDVFRCFSLKPKVSEPELARVFFRVFRQRLQCFEDSIPVLSSLKENGTMTAVFSDVPYGMPTELVLEDISLARLNHLLDIVVTSSDAGFRKPSPKTLNSVAEAANCNASEMTYVGNERKDIEAAKAFGCSSILLDRSQKGHRWGQDRTIGSLAEL